MTNQEIFDTVATHLLTQNKKSLRSENSEGCAYRSFDGLKCAVGVLIPDEVYTPEMEGMGTVGFPVEPALIMLGFTIDQAEGILSALQRVHDACDVERWPTRLLHVATSYGLSPVVVKQEAAQ